jgi:hypothetical protein
LDYAFDNKEVPSDLFEHFLQYPYLAAIFRRTFLDWHHVWYYVFQKIRCRHPLVAELARQARKGPDLSLLEKWYPGFADSCDASHRDEVVQNILKHLAPMSADEQARLESLDLPPLEVPPDLQHHLCREAVPPAVSPSSKRSSRSDPRPLVNRILESSRQLLGPEPPRTEWHPPALRLHISTGRPLTLSFATVPQSGWRVFVRSVLDEPFLRLLRLIAASVDPRSCPPGAPPNEARLRTLIDGTPLQRRVEEAVQLQWRQSAASRYRSAWPTQREDGAVLLSLRHVAYPYDWLNFVLVERSLDGHHYSMTEHTGLNYFQGSRPDSRHKLTAVRRLVHTLREVEQTQREGP